MTKTKELKAFWGLDLCSQCHLAQHDFNDYNLYTGTAIHRCAISDTTVEFSTPTYSEQGWSQFQTVYSFSPSEDSDELTDINNIIHIFLSKPVPHLGNTNYTIDSDV